MKNSSRDIGAIGRILPRYQIFRHLRLLGIAGDGYEKIWFSQSSNNGSCILVLCSHVPAEKGWSQNQTCSRSSKCRRIVVGRLEGCCYLAITSQTSWDWDSTLQSKSTQYCWKSLPARCNRVLSVGRQHNLYAAYCREVICLFDASVSVARLPLFPAVRRHILGISSDGGRSNNDSITWPLRPWWENFS